MDSALAPERLIAAAKRAGLSAACFTDHDSLWPVEAVRRLEEEHNFLILRGIEATTEWGHVLVFGVERYAVEMRILKRLRHIVEGEGGVMILAHPFRQGMVVDWRQVLYLFDGLEALNGANLGDGIYLEQLADEWGLCAVGGSDAHTVVEVGGCATHFERPVRNEEDLVRELRAQRCWPVDRRHLLPPLD